MTLDGSGSSDPDPDTLTYAWTTPAGITLSSTTAMKPTFTAPEVAENTNYTIKLVVNDGAANSSESTVVVTVNHVNKVPVANAGSTQTVNEGSVVTLDGSYHPMSQQTPHSLFELILHWLLELCSHD